MIVALVLLCTLAEEDFTPVDRVLEFLPDDDDLTVEVTCLIMYMYKYAFTSLKTKTSDVAKAR